MLNKITLTISLFFSVYSFSQCELTDSLIVTEPTCYGFSDGSISVFPYGGTGTITIEITNTDGVILNGGGVSILFLLGEGWYYIRLEDEDGCIFLDSVQIEALGPMEIEYTIVEPSGPDLCDGSVSIDTVVGQNGSYESLRYIWSPDPDFISGYGATLMTNACVGYLGVLIDDEHSCTIVREFDLGAFYGLEEQSNENLTTVIASNNNITINTQITDENLSFSIFDMAGNLVQKNLISTGENTIQVTVETGVYIYTIQSNKEIIKTGKLSFNQ